MGNYTAEYGVEDLTEVTTDAVAVGMITGKGFIGIWILGLIVLGIIGGVYTAIRKWRRG